ncbi:tetratricopeptide repeat protein [Mesonia sp. K7]|uniref:tetratricopeptide repeat protein n=1 Tax=Mesonia sp. K7 TaxID=2218606 RepID=UPI001313FF95|nr:tetratricopeptide repeat protein [Mesonia sp. K7]
MGIIFSTQVNFAQEIDDPDFDSIASKKINQEENQFQEKFFDALAQKAIENYDRAIDLLEACKKINPKAIIVDFELGKNYKSLKNYTTAEDYLRKVLTQKPTDNDVLRELYEVYALTQNAEKAIPIAEKLATQNVDYYEDLANLYGLTHQYEKALASVEKLDEKRGFNEFHQELRGKIFAKAKNPNFEMNYLQEQVDGNSANPNFYLRLMYMYKTTNQKNKMVEVAQKLQKNHPNSVLNDFYGYQVALQENKHDEAVVKIKNVVHHTEDESVKKMLLQDFVKLAQRDTKYKNSLMQLVESEITDQEIIENYYVSEDTKKGYNVYIKQLENDPTNFELLKKVIELELEQKAYDLAYKRSNAALEIYPSQPYFYYYKGVAASQIGKKQEAINLLKEGLDYIIDDENLTLKINTELKKLQ